MTTTVPERNDMVVIKENFLDCRDLRHAWKRKFDDLDKQGKYTDLTRTLVCVRCGTVRKDAYRVTKVSVTRMGSTYHYPEGYRVKGGLSIEEARLVLFTRWGMGLDT
jgi:hypothetical protein